MFQDKNKSILDLKDVFGILIAGVIFGSAIIVSIFLIIKSDPNSILDNFFFEDFNAASLVVGTVFFLIYAYIIGYVIEMFSSVIIDRWVIGHIFSYPSDNLLFSPKKHDLSRNPIRNGYRLFILALTLSFIFESFDHYCGGDGATAIAFCSDSETGFFSGIARWLLINADQFASYCKVFVIWLFGGAIVLNTIFKSCRFLGINFQLVILSDNPKGIFSSLLKRVLTLKIFKYNYEREVKVRKLLDKVFFGSLTVLAFPIRIFENLLRKIFALDKPLSKELLEQFKVEYLNLFGNPVVKKSKSEIYWLTRYFIELESAFMRDDIHRQSSQNGMTRNVSIALYFSALLLVYAAKESAYKVVVLEVSAVFLLAAFLLSVWAYYLYYSRSKSIFRRFVVLRASQKEAAQKEALAGEAGSP